MAKQAQILVIIGTWPSLTHPYLTRLFAGLKSTFGGMQLFLFEKSNPEFGFQLIGKEPTMQLLANALYRQKNIYHPLGHLNTWYLCLRYLRHSRQVMIGCNKEGLNLKQTYGQLFYYRMLLGKRYDLVHINALQTAYHFKTKAWFKNAKLLVSSRGEDFDFYPTKYDKTLRQIDHIHVLGEFLKKKVIERNSNLKNCISIIPPAFESQNLTNVAKKLELNSTIHIATAARLTWIKGYRYAFDTIKQLLQQGIDCHYHIYGDGPQKTELQFLIKLLNLENHITLYGWVQEDELIDRLIDKDFYLLLSIAEAFNNSAILAQSLALPCIVSNAGGLPENVIHMHTGIVVPKYNGKAAADAIATLIQDKERYEQLSKDAINRVASLKQPLQTAAFVNLYTKLLSA